MIFSLHGKLIYTNINTVVVECGGVGYKCSATLKTLATMPDIGGNVFVYTHMVVKEDSVDLYAFSSLDELDCFKLITSVNGVGPKIGIALLSDFSSDQVALYIASGDSKSLTKATGVGAKLAQRIVLELKDKVGGFSSAS
ncbi:MAG: Holliday junction branch migration protein RuvA, partial [Oscillospiraceae bacterium]